MKKVSASKNLHYLETIPLQFDNYTQEELMELTPPELQERFMSKYLKVIHPFTQYKEYFETSNTKPPVFLKFVKNFYKTYVVEEGWEEQKFVKVIDHICMKNLALAHKTMKNCGELYHSNGLDIQQKEKIATKEEEKNMSDKINKFMNVTDSDNISIVNHNPRNYNSFNDFQNSINDRFSKIENERSLKERKKNVRIWDKSLPNRWQGARLSKINTHGAEKALKIIHDYEFSSVFINGEAGTGKTFLSYAIARKFIEKGWVTPSEIKIISEENLMSIPKMGFTGQNNLDKILNSQYKLYIFDNAGSRESYDSKEGPIWEQLIDHIYTNSLVAIFTSPNSARLFSDKLTDTAESKFKHLIHKKIITVNNDRNRNDGLDDYSPEEEKQMRRLNNKIDSFNSF